MRPDDIENLNNPVPIAEIKFMIKRLPIKTTPSLNFTPMNSFKHLRKKWHQSFINSFKILRKGRIPISFYETTLTMIPKPDKNITRNKNYKIIKLNEHTYENGEKLSYFKKIIPYDQVKLI